MDGTGTERSRGARCCRILDLGQLQEVVHVMEITQKILLQIHATTLRLDDSGR